ncbi:energy transducer TonB [Sphingomonas bacterium]|uniref:energy transducer TonB n=1 Tax=Sphingomonas bacterium TaxID=1895847 RepID=UPI001576E31C|nr:energy transducer TonB [Sphingomonas bacterium]
MRAAFALLAGFLPLLAQPAAAQYAPPSDSAPQAPTAGADRLEQLLWEGAARKNSADAYQTYLRRYPDGAHSDQARDALNRMGQMPQSYRQPAPSQSDDPPADASPPPPYPQPDGPPAPPPYPQDAPPPAEPPMNMAPENVPAPPTPAPPIARPPTATAPIARPAAAGSPLFLCRPAFAGGVAPFEQAGEAEIGAYLQALRVNSVAAYKIYLQAFPRGVFSPEVRELIATRDGRAAALAATNVPGPSQARARAPVTIIAGDYPSLALREAQAGSASAIWEVSEDGCVQSCRIERSSGSAVLDAATCRVIGARGRYDPARDAAGKPIRSIETGSFTWALPQH